jgi:hypothetical protein
LTRRLLASFRSINRKSKRGNSAHLRHAAFGQEQTSKFLQISTLEIQLKFQTILNVVAALVFSHSASAEESKDCAGIVKTAQAAAAKADWVIEGNIDNTFRMTPSSGPIEVSIEKAKVVFELKQSPRFFTAVLQADPCFPNSTETLWGKNANKLMGKRMRFYGTKLTNSGSRRFFYMQPAEQDMPIFSAARPSYADREHVPIAKPIGSDGWSRARSTEGGFSVEMPGPFVDMTKGSGKEPAFMLRGTDRFGSTFIVVFERSGPDSEMAGTFDATYSEANAKLTSFKGANAVATLGKLPGSDGSKITHGLWFRVPGGTFMLGVVTDKMQEADAMQSKDRFFNSLSFE